jgi:hypothetical protein
MPPPATVEKSVNSADLKSAGHQALRVQVPPVVPSYSGELDAITGTGNQLVLVTRR